jgi:hypothetical protein
LSLPACVFTLGFNKFRVQSKCCHTNQVLVYKTYTIGGVAIEAEIKQAYTDDSKGSQNKHTDLRPVPCLLIYSPVNTKKASSQ